ncbi:uncharacterized protein BO88DRAFT_209745 [Aspergillus vadensis CBS 113365]|uniref:Uncharacterized protein n=1 Tax=Aspergillus vadensis (strain CBS 113365 / IMI 142717 / IBT 24658) TaxID=1448311 RepID=A0A319BHP8_ASPVC|nr:hypothetical protein BO88DRAFT_209745 [Aspergillus vadensis CBS 113365]PYH72275.1 hypothetical protein BO88DRAFT_209745 [Aspergillus vadensis CBS 113365]
MHAVETLEDVTQTCTCREPRLSRFCRNLIHRDLTVKLPRVSIYPFLEVIQNKAASSSVTMPGNTGRRTSGTALIKHDCGIARDKSDTWQCNFALEGDSSVDSRNAQPFHFLFKVRLCNPAGPRVTSGWPVTLVGDPTLHWLIERMRRAAHPLYYLLLIYLFLLAIVSGLGYLAMIN